MRVIYTEKDLSLALQEKETNIIVTNVTFAHQLILAYRVQNGLFPEIILKRLKRGGNCKTAVGDGVVINVNQKQAENTLFLLDYFESHKIELDVEDVVKKRINVYYGS